VGRDFPCSLSREAWRPHVLELLRDHGTVTAADATVQKPRRAEFCVRTNGADR
jgi:hypothetical protein